MATKQTSGIPTKGNGASAHYIVGAATPIPPGKHQVRVEFKYDGGGLAKGGEVTLYCDGQGVAFQPCPGA